MGTLDYLGEFEHFVLLALVRLEDKAYGITIRDTIQARAGREVSLGAVYSTLRRLQGKGYVESWVGEPTAQRGGRAKKYFRLTDRGGRTLYAAQQRLARMSGGLQVLPGRHAG